MSSPVEQRPITPPTHMTIRQLVVMVLSVAAIVGLVVVGQQVVAVVAGHQTDPQLLGKLDAALVDLLLLAQPVVLDLQPVAALAEQVAELAGGQIGRAHV